MYRSSIRPWDYLIVTASNRQQALAYERQLELRTRLGYLTDVRRSLVVADPDGKRIGSGGSTLYSLLAVLNQELSQITGDRLNPNLWEQVFRKLRILIVHAGGDSRRLPAYAPCGKLFIPVPGDNDGALTTTLFDRQIATYLGLPGPADDAGQIVVTAGDVLLTFDPSQVCFAPAGVTGLGCHSSPEEASRHGVYCVGSGGAVRLYLQKPSESQQRTVNAIDRYGRSVLDIGVLNFDSGTAARLLALFEIEVSGANELQWSQTIDDLLKARGLDVYREVCCAMGSGVDFDRYLQSAVESGSILGKSFLSRLFEGLSIVPFHAQTIERCGFLHFGTTRHIIESGAELARRDRGLSRLNEPLTVNTVFFEGGGVLGADSWIEGCRVHSPVQLGGANIVVGADIERPLELGVGDCLDVVEGQDRLGHRVFFNRLYAVSDSFKGTSAETRFCGQPLRNWIQAMGARDEQIWPAEVSPEARSIWNARLFVATAEPSGFFEWLWLFKPEDAGDSDRKRYLDADRYSLSEMGNLADFEAFYRRRAEIRATEIGQSLSAIFRPDSRFSASELAWILERSDQPDRLIQGLIAEARWHAGSCAEAGMQIFTLSRLVHSLGTAVALLGETNNEMAERLVGALQTSLGTEDREWLASQQLCPEARNSGKWRDQAQDFAFDQLGCAILDSASTELQDPPRNALRPDEIVWGRAPARLDLGGGWTDTPPYSLEFGGSVINAAVNLNGQPPIQCYARVTEDRVIRIGSIDQGTRIQIADFDSLLDYRQATSEFGLAKAALALSGFCPAVTRANRPATLGALLDRFGGGVELTTLAAIPKGSGLGTSSIMGAVVLSVIARMLGRTLSQRDLFHAVLRLEQALTTGGGWQDQIGGAVDGVKVISCAPGLIPDPRIHYVPADVLDPRSNRGTTLLFYTGITRLAKNILRDVVGRYLDRDRTALATLRQLHGLPPLVADTMARKDLPAFGRMIDTAWRLNKQLDPHSSNEKIESLLQTLAPHLHGAKLLGAGGGGFLLMVCKSPEAAAEVRALLTSAPPNPRSRFFDFDVSAEGLVVSVC